MSDHWFQERYDDAVWAERESLGLCGNCALANKPGHMCPPPEREATR